MNRLMQALASEQWRLLVEALLHTLWFGGLVAAALYFGLRRATHPVTRYRLSAAALLAVVLGGIIAWALLQPRPLRNPSSPGANASTVAASPARKISVVSPDLSAVPARYPMSHPPSRRWTSWLALLWLAGTAVMLARAGALVIAAEKLCRKSAPLKDQSILNLVQTARLKLGLVRRVQVVVTEQLTSPAVMGVIVPVLILPLSMITALPPAQLQLILLHELAHIRRRDYFFNLCQLLAESLLFFNPAVWWISRQIRQEREACCDAVAIALAGERIQYARTLAEVAGNVLAAAPAFSDQRNPSGLKDRIQRLLVPGYRPAFRPAWNSLLTTFFLGGGLLFLSALGARVTVAAILTPQQRIDRIEKRMVELGEKPVPGNSENDERERISVSVHLRTPDGAPLPKNRSASFYSSTPHRGAIYGVQINRDGMTKYKVAPGQVWIEADVDGYAPVLAGPFDGLTTNQVDAGNIILNAGFDVSLQVLDAASGVPVANAALRTQFINRQNGQSLQSKKNIASDAAGRAVLPHCIDQQLLVIANAPGYAIVEQRFERLAPGPALVVKLKPGDILAGTVVDNVTGESIPDAELRILGEQTQTDSRFFGWVDPAHFLGRTDAAGHFSANQFRRGLKYTLAFSAPGHQSLLVDNAALGATNLVVRLGPELIVHGRVLGQLDRLQKYRDLPALWRSWSQVIGDHNEGDGDWVSIHVTNGIASFQFTNRSSGFVTLAGRDFFSEKRNVTAPVADWVVDLDAAQKKPVKPVPTREVVFRFKHPSGVLPRGTVSVGIPDNLDRKNLTVHDVELEITNGEVRVAIAIGGRTSIMPKRMPGYWFDRAGEKGRLFSLEVSNAPGPLIVEIPLLPAGAIYARALNADGTVADGLLYGIAELEPAPGRSGALDTGDSATDFAPRKWISNPLPLGGTYQVYGWRGNSFCASKPIQLTEASPDADVDLQFPPGKTFAGVVLGLDGAPLADTEVKVSCVRLHNHSFGLKSIFTDGQGRFQIDNATPEFADYSVEVNTPGLRDELVKLNFGSQPQTIRLQRGFSLGGLLVDAATGFPLPDAEIRVADPGNRVLPMVKTRTDASGRFEFTSLGDAEYTFYASDGQLATNKKFRADGSTNLVVPIKLYAWSKVKPKAP